MFRNVNFEYNDSIARGVLDNGLPGAPNTNKAGSSRPLVVKSDVKSFTANKAVRSFAFSFNTAS